MQYLLDNYGFFQAWLLTGTLFYLRYLLAAGLAFLVFYQFFPGKFMHRKIQQRLPKGKRIFEEIKHSLYTAFIFTAIFLGLVYLQKLGYTRLYMDWSEHSTAYFILTCIALIFIHDTYFYWAHRLMHHPKLFAVHKEHHRSRNPTPWSSFDFHPVEAILEIAFVPVLVFFIPLHPASLFFLSFWLLIWNIVGHLGYEIFSKNHLNHPVLKWLNTSTHHNLHHQRAHYNFGLYFNFWDHIMGTNDPCYRNVYESVTSKKRTKNDRPINLPLKKASKHCLEREGD